MVASNRELGIWPWILAALVLAAGAALLLWRNRRREVATAGGAGFDLFAATEPAMPPPAPAPAPAPAPVPAADLPSPAPAGVVSTMLRPWLELTCRPLRCVLEDRQLTVEFELELYNSGTAAADGVLVEARLFNAGPAQDHQLEHFFANPLAQGERSLVIAPQNRLAIKSEVVAPRDQLQAYDLGGKQVFVPLIGFNALYRWGRGEGQSSVSYLLGRDTGGEKLGPLRLDLGARIFRAVGGKLLPNGVRR